MKAKVVTHPCRQPKCKGAIRFRFKRRVGRCDKCKRTYGLRST